MKSWSVVFISIALIMTPLAAGAAGRQFYKCTLAEGKTMADLHAWAADWRIAADAAGLGDYKNSILLPLGNKDMPQGTYYWEAAAPSSEVFAAVDRWFSESSEAKAFQERFSGIASCEQPTNWRVSE